jgi:hypothetical protein
MATRLSFSLFLPPASFLGLAVFAGTGDIDVGNDAR